MVTYSIAKEKKKFIKKQFFAENCFLNKCTSNLNSKDYLIYSSALSNLVWNSWNNFWRTYWIVHTVGGIGINKNRIQPISNLYAKYNYLESCHYLVALHKVDNITLLGNIKHNFGDRLIGTHQEKTWGNKDIIEKLALNFSNIHPNNCLELNKVINLLSLYGDSIKDFNTIRNAMMHLTNDTVISILKPISSSYIMPNNNLLEIYKAKNFDNEECFIYLTRMMKGYLMSI